MRGILVLGDGSLGYLQIRVLKIRMFSMEAQGLYML